MKYHLRFSDRCGPFSVCDDTGQLIASFIHEENADRLISELTTKDELEAELTALREKHERLVKATVSVWRDRAYYYGILEERWEDVRSALRENGVPEGDVT